MARNDETLVPCIFCERGFPPEEMEFYDSDKNMICTRCDSLIIMIQNHNRRIKVHERCIGDLEELLHKKGDF
ncbi:hypothetical protein [Metaclostridioides mangenotii]|uniref:hypothetical protein n=1 Tax=Metaclostridioides mangenotii TaxID=1540 RepID=UPI0028E4BAEE|nr:hypothetical protein [Clostridioides mangenotii]